MKTNTARDVVLGLVTMIGFFMMLAGALGALSLSGDTGSPGIVGAILFVGGMVAMGQGMTHDRLDAIRKALKDRPGAAPRPPVRLRQVLQ